MLTGSIAPVARAALAEGKAGLARFAIQLFRPLRPMLAQTADDVTDALARLPQAGFEYKLDGARVQVHKAGNEVRIFTRELNDVTAAAPEIVEAIGQLPIESLILDGEAIAFRPDGMPQPFQVTMRRFGRKLDVAAMRESLPLSGCFFDCLYVDGNPLIDRPQDERFAALAAALPRTAVIPRLVTGDAHAAHAFVEEALARGHEGVMAKALDAPYEAGARGAGWLKIKRAHTLDLVVLAAEWGNGRRRGWLSNLHLGARDPATGGFVMLGKTFKGMTDAMLDLADAAPAGDCHRPRRLHRPRPTRTGGRDRLQRHPGQPALSRRHGAALRPRQTLSPGQARRRGRYHRHRAARCSSGRRGQRSKPAAGS